MTTVALEGMKFYAFHGFYEKEREIGNQYVLDVYCKVPQFDSEDDNIHDTLNYENVYRTCKKYMDRQFKLLETIALHIAQDLKENYPHILHIKVRVTKLNPPLEGMVDRAIVEYEI